MGEGGGQIIRTAVSLSAITGEPIHVFNVRAGRAKPGLQRQHEVAVSAAARICKAEVRGVTQHSTQFWFEPTEKVQAGEFYFEIGTAGSTTLVLQTILVPLALTGEACKVTIVGGTHNPMAPPSDYLERVYLRLLARAGLTCDFKTHTLGFHPKGGGEIRAEFWLQNGFHPLRLLERGALVDWLGIIRNAGLKRHIEERGIQSLKESLPSEIPVHTHSAWGQSPSTGIAAFAYAEYEHGAGGFTSLGVKGKPMEAVAGECGAALTKWVKSGAPVDEHLADQLVLPMCFADGPSTWRTSEVTEHLRTVLEVVQMFLPISYELAESEDGSGVVRLTPVP